MKNKHQGRVMSLAQCARHIVTRCCLYLLLTSSGLWQMAQASEHTPRRTVLVITSYHAGLAWTDGQLSGLRDGFANAQPAVELHVEFLDTKRVAPSQDYFASEARLLEKKYRHIKPELIITQDDDALDFALCNCAAAANCSATSRWYSAAYPATGLQCWILSQL